MWKCNNIKDFFSLKEYTKCEIELRLKKYEIFIKI